MRKFWWCGQTVNPENHAQNTDGILYEAVNLTTGAIEGPRTVLAETPGGWDSAYTCNPRVIGGSFNNPFNDGRPYQFAMYYVGTANPSGVTNSIGVAFSNDGISWKKYPQPIISTKYLAGYGVGQPVAYNADGKSAITLFYEDSDPPIAHVAARSVDGVHFFVYGTLTTVGLDQHNPEASWGDMAYDMKTDSWYAIFNTSFRVATTTGGVPEWGQPGVELYRIPASTLFTGTTPWQELATIDTNLTGYESNFIAGFVHDPYGNINVASSPNLQLYVAQSDPQPAWNASPAASANSARPEHWDIHLEEWSPNKELLSLYRYFNGSVHEVTTGWVDPSGGFNRESLLGKLYRSPQQGATVAFYGCKAGNSDYFISPDSACEGQRILGNDGYGYSHPVSGLSLNPLFRCKTSHDHFVSRDPNCEGQVTEERLGYVLP